MKTFRNFILFCLIILFSGFFSIFLCFFLSPKRPRPLYTQAYIQLLDTYTLNFTEIGIAISSPHTSFYSPHGFDIEPPFKAEDFINLPLGFSINMTTDNYLLINEKYIFSTDKTPFKLAWRSEGKLIKDMFEIGDFLLLLIKDHTNFLVPYIFDPQSDKLTSLQGLLGSYFLDVAICESTDSFSILTFSDDGLFPSSTVLHYDNNAALYGALTFTNSMYFNIYKMQSHFVLIGIDQIVCYNANGIENWRIDIQNAYRHSKVSSSEYVWLYFNHSPVNFTNTLRISKDSFKQWVSLPRSLSSLQSYNEGLIGVLNNTEIVVFNSSGKMTARFIPEIDIDKLYYDSELPDNMFVLDRFGRLFSYTIFATAEKERSR